MDIPIKEIAMEIAMVTITLETKMVSLMEFKMKGMSMETTMVVEILEI